MIREFCAENYTDLEVAIEKGIDRIELCDALAVGGTTPSYGVIKASVQLAKKHNVNVVVMIRPRQGDFCYTAVEQKIMEQDIDVAFDLGADGVVFGCLNQENELDLTMMKELMERVGKRGEVVFHMAFDSVRPDKKYDTLDQLISLGVTRILLHGHNKEQSAIENKDEINEYIRYANNRIEFIVGGGVTYENVASLSNIVETNQFHGTKIV
ncbi:copper homeostasis protein CutC [Halolactibacillus alkaliphilus]|uniref:PF03932 family protein CutC n=1 Tax=Halolactibacillus alkaliphilus TaxID=442899 RepID=A0A511WX12_9BACI|nr:copper homeostasis protein CutC [Halolactibacillus alkaliphilus]GEN55660.1 copper homeostasis protein CutC [Halolactibacillus alkaliphilus]GGN63551.1 copper homeostasis protein CutC [Halolactibacillus alkaliphilus]SFO62898.1 copper homeostasis protein [Halolactibacillus alkaliphilus]